MVSLSGYLSFLIMELRISLRLRVTLTTVVRTTPIWLQILHRSLSALPHQTQGGRGLLMIPPHMRSNSKAMTVPNCLRVAHCGPH